MFDVGVGAGLELVGDDPVLGDRLERQRPHESTGRRRHDGDDLVPVLLQPPSDFHRLVGPDATGHAKGNSRHASSPVNRGGTSG